MVACLLMLLLLLLLLLLLPLLQNGQRPLGLVDHAEDAVEHHVDVLPLVILLLLLLRLMLRWILQLLIPVVRHGRGPRLRVDALLLATLVLERLG